MNAFIQAARAAFERCTDIAGGGRARRQRQNLQVVFEICFPALQASPTHVFGQAVRADSAATFAARKTGTTPRGQSIYRACTGLEGLRYLLVSAPKDPMTAPRDFVFERPFRREGPDWSGWQACTSVTSDGHFFWLATRSRDRSAEAVRQTVPPAEQLKVRFRLMPFKDYLQLIRRDTDPTLDVVDDVDEVR